MVKTRVNPEEHGKTSKEGERFGTEEKVTEKCRVKRNKPKRKTILSGLCGDYNWVEFHLPGPMVSS